MPKHPGSGYHIHKQLMTNVIKIFNYVEYRIRIIGYSEKEVKWTNKSTLYYYRHMRLEG